MPVAASRTSTTTTSVAAVSKAVKQLEELETCSAAMVQVLTDALVPAKAALGTRSTARAGTVSTTDKAERIALAAKTANTALNTLTNLVVARKAAGEATTAASKPDSVQSVRVGYVVEAFKLALSLLRKERASLRGPLDAERLHSNLINKLRELDMVKEALSELFVLKRYLQKDLNEEESVSETATAPKTPARTTRSTRTTTTTKTPSRTTTKSKDPTPAPATTADPASLLLYPFPPPLTPPSPSILPLILLAQFNTLRLLTRIPKLTLTTTLSSALSVSCTQGPVAWAQFARNREEEKGKKALGQIWGVVVRIAEGRGLLPEERVEVVGHAISTALLLPDPDFPTLNKLLEKALTRASTSPYDSVTRALGPLLSDSGLTPSVEVCAALSFIARASNKVEEAQGWTERASKTTGISVSTRIALAAHQAALALESSGGDGGESSGGVEETMKVVEGFLRHEVVEEGVGVEEWERMLKNIELLRSRIAKTHTKDRPSRWGEVVWGMVEFLGRHREVGSGEWFGKVVGWVLEYASTLAREAFKLEDSTTYNKTHELLSRCTTLATIPSLPTNTTGAGTYLSNTFFNLAVLLHNASKRAEAIPFLRSSVEVARVVGDKDIGRVTKKLELLSYCLYAAGDLKGARLVRFEGLAMLFGQEMDGEGEGGGNVFGKMALVEGWSAKERETLARFICEATKMSVHFSPNSSLALPEMEKLDPGMRGAVLEWQLRVINRGGVTNVGMTKNAVGLASQALQCYEVGKCPVRRGRAMSKLLPFVADDISISVPFDVISEARHVVEVLEREVLGDDVELRRYAQVVLGSLKAWIVQIGYLRDEPDVEGLSAALRVWKNALLPAEDAVARKIHDTVAEHVEDPEALFGQLGMLKDLCDFKSLPFQRLSVLKLMLHVRRNAATTDTRSDYVELSAALGLQYCRLGYTGKAGMVFAKSQSYVKEAKCSASAMIAWELAYCEYLVLIGNVDKSREHYRAAGALAENLADLEDGVHGKLKAQRKTMRIYLTANAAYTLSRVLFESGGALEATLHADHALRLLKRALKNAAVLSRKENPVEAVGSDAMEDNPFAEPRSDPSEKPKPASRYLDEEAQMAQFYWPIVSAWLNVNVLMGELYLHRGTPKAAQHYLQVALEAARFANANADVAHILSLLGDLHARSGNLEMAKQVLEEASNLQHELENRKEAVQLSMSVAGYQGRLGNEDAQVASYLAADKTLAQLMSSSFVQSMDEMKPVDGVVDGMNNMQISPAKKKRSAKDASLMNESTMLSKMKADVLRALGLKLAVQGHFDDAQTQLQEAMHQNGGDQDIVLQRLAEAKVMFLQAVDLLRSDPVLCVLQDAAISLPSIHHATGDKSSPKVKAAKTPAKSRRTAASKSLGAPSEIGALLSKSRDVLVEVFKVATKTCPATTVQALSSLLGSIMVLHYAIALPSQGNAARPSVVHYFLDSSKGITLGRERAFFEAEERLREQMQIVREKDFDLAWPAPMRLAPVDPTTPLRSSAPSTRALDGTPTRPPPGDVPHFQQDFINIIPSNWMVVSVTLSEDLTELYIGRVQSGQAPLVLRLPLNRHAGNDDEDMDFSYETALEELKEVLSSSNASTKRAKDIRDRETKLAWWNERMALDARLKVLLENIELCWLGGFKGIFNNRKSDAKLFARFRASFAQIMSKHLPFCRGRKSKAAGDIDARLLELFIALGPPPASDVDNDEDKTAELLEDIIYFVLDIYQFHGEPIAYDEVDIDQMVVDLQEALRSYHEALGKVKDNEEAHLILILDKSVQMFPWESLPVMRGQSVSRLPSLAALRERLQRLSGPEEDSDDDESCDGVGQAGDVVVCKESGSFILNPSGDLVNTQKVFADKFSNLPGWTGIIGRTPMEEEYRRALTSPDIFIYMGHGSGEQYLRSAALNRLKKCAVTLLMGCSSGELKEAGDFEPSGTALSYVIAGCPTLVANLWDVTDKDIDLFSVKVLERWGLLKEDETKKHSKRTDAEGKTSLVRAVALSRDECTLKYLNGAAPVVYGIPCYLK
ncbi:separin protein [Saitoella coloradoensis]